MSIDIRDMEHLHNCLSEAGDLLVVMDFMATWCGPCKRIGPKMDDMAYEMRNSVVFLKIDVDECEVLADKYDINSMPTFVFIKNSQTLDRFSGANVEKLRRTILKWK